MIDATTTAITDTRPDLGRRPELFAAVYAHWYDGCWNWSVYSPGTSESNANSDANHMIANGYRGVCVVRIPPEICP